MSVDTTLRVTEHIVVEDFKDKINNNLLERFNGTFKNAIRAFRGLKAIRFPDKLCNFFYELLQFHKTT